MRRTLLIASAIFAAASFGAAQITRPSTGVLGAHLNYGRGCAACHAPHSRAAGNGIAKLADPASGDSPLWGATASKMYGKAITAGEGKFVEVLPSGVSANTPEVAGMLTCLSCHDGNYAPKAMMKNRVYETLPATYGVADSIPTLMGTSSGSSGSYLDDHHMGLNALVNCEGENWDSAVANGVPRMKGSKSSEFVANRGPFIRPGSSNDSAVVVCTSCHDPHSMNVVGINGNRPSGLPASNYATMLFARACCNPNDTNPLSNQTAQLCRQCHADRTRWTELSREPPR